MRLLTSSKLQLLTLAALSSSSSIHAFTTNQMNKRRARPSAFGVLMVDSVSQRSGDVSLFASVESEIKTAVGGFIETELRGAAMKLHTRFQAPKEGQAEAKKREPYTPTRADYLAFLVDSQHVYQALEDIVNDREELVVFRGNGMERVAPLETDIEFMTKEYGLARPEVGKPGSDYAEAIRRIGKEGSIGGFMCHYYNYYFAHTAGGRMIGKQMSALLLDKKTLEFYTVRIPKKRERDEGFVLIQIPTNTQSFVFVKK
jgi:hypothetical protein